jgi:hypothetical protein
VTSTLELTVFVSYLNDVGIHSIDTFQDEGTYPQGHYFISSTTKNFGFSNQSSYNVSLEIRKLGDPVKQTVFSDDMESGTNGWQVVDLDGTSSPDSWKLVTTSSNSPTTSWWCGAASNYNNNTAQLLVSPSFSLKEALGANLSFYHRYETHTGNDFGSVDIFNGIVWKTLASYDGNGPASFQNVELSLKDFLGLEDLKLRFRFTTNEWGYDEGWYIDDMEISGEFYEETTIFGPVLNQTSGIIDQGYTQQLGWQYTFTQIGYYKIYSTTLLESDEQVGNNQSHIRIHIIPSPDNGTVLKQGWNLISIPNIQTDENLIKVLENIDGLYDSVQIYDTTDPNDTWKHNNEGKSYGNDLALIDETMGFWIHITQPGDTIFFYNGTKPTENQTIYLRPGWNLVGYPSSKSYNRTKALNNITFGTDVDAVWTYNAGLQKWDDLTQADYFELGKGYWIHSLVEKTWYVPL